MNEETMTDATPEAAAEPMAETAATAAARLDQATIDRFASRFASIAAEVRKDILSPEGEEDFVAELLTALFARGHVLLESRPGLGKTTLVRSLGAALGLQFGRVQFTPDLMPADITGTTILRTDERGGLYPEFQPGPIFANVLLADEINRASPKTQAALLEAMAERQMTVAGTTYKPGQNYTDGSGDVANADTGSDAAGLFHVLATQNPIEQEGTYPLPEAQLDRFLLKIDVQYPDLDTERRILIETTTGEDNIVRPALDAERLIALQSLVRRMPVGEKIVSTILALVRDARPEQTSDERVKRLVDWGPSPRAGQALMLAARSRALLRGRLAPSIEDVEALAEPCLGHRMAMRYDPTGEAPSLTDLINDLARKVG